MCRLQPNYLLIAVRDVFLQLKRVATNDPQHVVRCSPLAEYLDHPIKLGLCS